MRKTFEDILKQHDGIGPGFDLLRLALALAILLTHLAPIGGTRGIFPLMVDAVMGLFGSGPVMSIPVPPGDIAAVIPVQPLHAPPIPDMGLGATGLTKPIVLSHVPMFFALSGFLVAGSAFRRRVMPFLALRFFRIFPALCVEVVLSAILIGAVFTSLPLSVYFTAHEFWTYFGNILGIVQMELPGVVFRGSGKEHVAVNANLWTLPAKFYSYLILALLMISDLVFNRTVFSVLFVLVTAGLLVANIAFGYNATPGLLAGDVNVYYFFAGVMFFLWRDHIPYSVWLFIPCVVLVYFLMLAPRGVYIAPLLLTYITVFIGLTDFPKSRLLQSGDYSYGIYLYGFPISLVLVECFPALRNNFLAAMIPVIACTGLFAFLSWHLVEKRFLKLRKHFSVASAKIAEELHPGSLALGGAAKDHRENPSHAGSPHAAALNELRAPYKK